MTQPGGSESKARPRDDGQRYGFLANLSLRTKLLAFAVALTTVPGIVFTLVAFPATRSTLEKEVGIQLEQTAGRGADAVATLLQRTRTDIRSWSGQDVMRDLLVGDIDKRVSRFLQAILRSNQAYADVLCVDTHGKVIASGNGDSLGNDVTGWRAWPTLRDQVSGLTGPIKTPLAPSQVLLLTEPIHDPDQPAKQIATLISLLRWSEILSALDAVRVKLIPLGKTQASFIVDASGAQIGGVSFDGSPVGRSTALVINGDTRQQKGQLRGSGPILFGSAAVRDAPEQWSVVFVERATDALATVTAMRQRWLILISTILALGLIVAALLARQFMSPLAEVTRTTAYIAANPDLELPPLPVRSNDEVGQLTRSFNKMTSELKRSQEETLSAAKFAFAGQLAAMVAHEVRTPLTVMRSSAQLLTATPSDDQQNHELVETIVAEVDRIQRVVNGLIELARPLEQKLEPVDLRELLTRAFDFTHAEAARKQIRITSDLSVDPGPALCDPDQIYQVILNLVVNALQALENGGTIHLRTLPRESDQCGFEISDDGPGLPEHLTDDMFHPFVTGREDGTGLGLAFVDRVVKAHGGRVEVQTRSGHGTVFAIHLPATEDKK